MRVFWWLGRIFFVFCWEEKIKEGYWEFLSFYLVFYDKVFGDLI